MAIKGLKEIQVKIKGLDDKKINELLEKACIMVQEDASDRCPRSGINTGWRDTALADSIQHYVDGHDGVVGTNVPYAPYVHQGTGIYAIDGNGRQDGWWYPATEEMVIKYCHPSDYQIAGEPTKYTDAYYWNGQWWIFTRGQTPKPFLTDALDANEDKIKALFEDAVKENL